MMVSFDPAALQKGATAFSAKAEAIRGHAATVANLTALRTAFGGVGAQVWQAVEAELDRIRRQLEAVNARAANTGTAMGVTGNGASTIDQENQTTVRNIGR